MNIISYMEIKFHVSGTFSMDVTILFIKFILRNNAVYVLWNDSQRKGTTLGLEEKVAIQLENPRDFYSRNEPEFPYVDTVPSIFKYLIYLIF